MAVKIAIWGGGGHALVVEEAIRASGLYDVACFIVDEGHSVHPEFSDRHVVVGTGEQLAELRASGVSAAVVALGDCATRLRRATVLQEQGFAMVRVIHPRAIVASSARVGEGTVVVAGAVLGPEVDVGKSAIVNTGATVDHHTLVGDGAHVAPGAHIAGCCQIGRGALVGIGAVLVQNVSIGEGAVVGAGSVVVRDVPPDTVAYGVPARVVRRVPG